VDGFVLDSPSCLDFKKVWVYNVHTHSFLAKYILVHASCMHLSKCLQPITTFHCELHVISLVPWIFKIKNIDLLAKMLGSWPFLLMAIVCLFAGCCAHTCVCFLCYFERIIYSRTLFFFSFILVPFSLCEKEIIIIAFFCTFLPLQLMFTVQHSCLFRAPFCFARFECYVYSLH